MIDLTYHLLLTITYHLSLTTYYLSLITYYLLLITYHLSLITYYLLLTTYSFLHSRFLLLSGTANGEFGFNLADGLVVERIEPYQYRGYCSE